MQSPTFAPRPPRSATTRAHRDRTFPSQTASSNDDDNVSLNSSFSGSLRKNMPRISTSEFGTVRAATMGVARMKNERKSRNKSTADFLNNSLSDSLAPSGRTGRRTSIYSLSELAGAGATVKRRKRSTLDHWGQRTAPGVTKYFDKNLPPVELLRRCIRLVQMFASLCQYKFEKETEESDVAHTVFTQYINDDEDKPMDGGLAFDASFYKANRKMRVSAEVKNILQSPQEQRTEQQCAKVLFSLRSIRAFAEYPQRIQHKLINVGWYESHSSKRAILRQGQIPQAFYFVLSGSAVVTVLGEHDAFARTVHFLRRGDSFGELAILHDTQRQSTVISREPIELLVISREDFIDIFMLAGGIKNITDPDHQIFLRSLEFLKGWPIELLATNPKKCLFHFFRSGSVLVKDSNHTDWIYIIKWGSCQVLKKLKEVKSRLTEHKDRVVGFDNVRSLVPKADSRARLDRVKAKLSIVTKLMPKLNLRPLTENVNEEETDANNNNRDEGVAIEQVAAAQGILATYRRQSMSDDDSTSLPGTESSSSSPRPVRRVSSHEGPRRVSVPAEGGGPEGGSKALGVTGGGSGSRRQSLKRSVAFQTDEERESPDVIPLTTRNRRQRKLASPNAPLPSLAPVKSPDVSRGSSARSRDSRSPSPGPASEFMRRVRSKSIRNSPQVLKAKTQEEEEEESSLPQQKISVIDEGAQKQGVQSMLFDDQPSLSLVSNGAECIMISKKFYLSHCTDAMRRRLLTTETPYPNDDALQRSLQDKVNWDAYKKKTMKSVVNSMPYMKRRSEDLQVHRKYKGKDMELSQELRDMLKKLQDASC
ncbi:uncharacterized protein LOC5520360 isoform X2 [Nematostella vectensis]|uniref:uncharacterized protein LOC5520360 isoform X2 n=1 Tax=Nematostella vectensis TaxID=45351 RepID=UPI00207785BA|nr:uncharacterized protein LOC5520360 isoform X2 [Nematostella vectensis]